MSKTIDEKVVSMQFDNRNFESNVRTTLSTLDKLKAKLNLSGAAKGLEDINAASRNFTLSPMGSAVESVQVKFSNLQVAALTCLQNITNQAFNTAKAVLHSLTIQPVTTGFNEYELKMNSIQTIMASTGESLQVVNKYLDELNKYSDETIYSFADMTQNIGKFTNAGIGLEDAVIAIKGIANEAALSGANANEASRAMYNFSQALSTGYVQRIDWKSIELANMATVEFKEELLKTAMEMGTVTQSIDGLYAAFGDDKFYNTSQMFIETLDEQWLTSEVLIETLKRYADTTTDIGNRATQAATEVKTFTHMMDTLKESAQSGWAKSWEIVFGDFDEGKNLWTSLNKVISGIIEKSADKRNNMLTNVFGGGSASKWDQLIAKVNEAGIATDVFHDSIRETATEHGIAIDELVEEYGSLAKVFKSGKVSTDIFTKSLKKILGVNNDLTETIASLTEYTVKEGDTLTSIAEKYGTTWKEIYDVNRDIVNNPDLIFPNQVLKIPETCQKLASELVELSDEQLMQMGITGDQIKALRELEEIANSTGESINDLFDEAAKPSGRDKIITAFKTIFQKIQPLLDGFKQTWDKVFGNFPGIEDMLNSLIDAFAKFADELKIDEAKIDSITKSFEGLLRVGELAAIMTGGIWGYIIKILKLIGNELDVDFWDTTETIAEMIIAFRNWILTNNSLYESLLNVGKAAITFLTDTGKMVKGWVDSFLAIPYVNEVIKNLSNSFTTFVTSLPGKLQNFVTSFSEFFSELLSLETFNVDDILLAFIKLIHNIFGNLGDAISGFSTPFTYAREIIVSFIATLMGGSEDADKFAENCDKVRNVINNILDPIKKAIAQFKQWYTAIGEWIEALKDVEDLPTAIGEGIGRGLATLANTVIGEIKNIATQIWAGMTGAGEDGIAGLVAGLVGGIATVAGAIWDVATALITTFCSVLSIESPSKVMMALGAFVIIGLVMGIKNSSEELWAAIVSFGDRIGEMFTDIFTKLLDILGDFGQSIATFFQSFDMGKIMSTTIIIGMLALVYKIVDLSVRIAEATTGMFEGFKKFSEAMGGFVKGILNSLDKVAKAAAFRQYAAGIKEIAIALGILAAAVALLTVTYDPEKTWKAVGVFASLLGMLAGFAALLFAFQKLGGSIEFDIKGIMLSMLGVVGAIVLISYAASKLEDISSERFNGIATAIVAFLLSMSAVVASVARLARYGNPEVIVKIGVIGNILLKTAAAMLILAYAGKVADSIQDPGKIIGLIMSFGVLVGALLYVGGLAKGSIDDVGKSLFKIGAAFGLMALAAKLAGSIKQEELNTAVGMLGLFEILVMGLIGALGLISMIPGRNVVDDIGNTIAKIGAAMLAFAVAAKIMGSIGPDEAVSAIFGMIGTLVAMEILLFTLERIEVKKLDSIGKTILGISAGMALLAVAAKIFASFSSLGEWASGVGSIIALGAGIAGLIWVLGKIDAKNLKGVGTTLLFASGAIAVLAVVVSLVGMIPIEYLEHGLKVVTALGLLMACIIMATKDSQDAKNTLIGMTIAIAVFTAAVAALALLADGHMTELIVSAIALAVMMGTLAGTIRLISGKKVEVNPILTMVLGLVAVAGALLLLSKFGGEHVLEAGFGLFLGLMGLSGAITLINKWGKASSGDKTAKNTLKMINTLGLIVIAIGAAIAAMSYFGGENVIAASAGLSMVLLALAGAMAIINSLGKASSGGKTATNTLKMLGVMVLAIGVIGVVLAQLATLNPESALASAVALGGVLLAMSAAMAIIGNFGGNATSVGSLLAVSVAIIAIGAALMMIGTLPTDKIWSSFGALAASMAVLTVVVIVLAAAFTRFAPGAAMVAVVLLAISATAVSVGLAAIMFAKALDMVSQVLPGLATGLDMLFTSLGHGLAAFVTSLGSCSKYAWGFIGVCTALAVGFTLITVGLAVLTVGLTIAAAGAVIFSAGLVILSAGVVIAAAAIVIFAGALATGAAAVYFMAGAISFLGYCISEGLAAGIANGIDLVTQATTGFFDAVVGTICELFDINSPSWVMQLIGRYVGEGFALGITDSEGDVANASTSLAEATKFNMGLAGAEGGNAFNMEALKNMDFASIMSGNNIDGSTITELFSNIGTESGTAFTTGAEGSIDFTSILSGSGVDATSLTTMFGNLGIESGSALTTSAAENTSMQPTIETMLGEISDASPKFSEAGGNVIKEFAEGLTQATSTAAKAMATIIENLAKATRTGWSSMYSAGKYLVTGFASGITANTFRAEAAAAAMAAAAYEAAKEELDINSPSKVFRALGASIPEGFAMGIGMYGGRIVRSVETMTGQAIDNTRNLISRISDAINMDIDSQPTIRPVLDLSDVSAGVNSMNGMFDMNPSMRVMSNIGTISTMMNSRQNGGNDDVISAIADLGRQLGVSRGDIYNINGVSYSDDAEVADAFRLIVRKAQVERRR